MLCRRRCFIWRRSFSGCVVKRQEVIPRVESGDSVFQRALDYTNAFVPLLLATIMGNPVSDGGQSCIL